MPAGDSSQPVLASCAGDAEVRLHDLTSGSRSVFDHHGSRVKKMVTEPGNPHLIISCSEDGTGAPAENLLKQSWLVAGCLLLVGW
jgi:hypothetical protein